MNATVRLLRWCGIGAMLGGMTLAALAQYQFRTEVNPDGTLTVYKGASCPRGALTIPEDVDGRRVTSIGDEAFDGCSGLTNVTIPNGITNIGGGAFDGCTTLTSITIPESVKTIGEAAFYGCGKLSSVMIPAGLTVLGGFAFFHCTKLTSATIPDGVTIIWGTFAGCESLTNVTIGRGVTRIGWWAFKDCKRLSSITIPNSVTEITGLAFGWCTSLTNVTIPSSVTRLENAFHACTNLLSVAFDGNAPSCEFGEFSELTKIYYLPGTQGWTSTFAGRPTAPWVRPNPTILDFGDRFGPSTNGFGFVISWATNVPVVVEATADIYSQGWTPISTNTLTDGWVQFTDPEWLNQPARFYRVRGEVKAGLEAGGVARAAVVAPRRRRGAVGRSWPRCPS